MAGDGPCQERFWRQLLEHLRSPGLAERARCGLPEQVQPCLWPGRFQPLWARILSRFGERVGVFAFGPVELYVTSG